MQNLTTSLILGDYFLKIYPHLGDMGRFWGFPRKFLIFNGLRARRPV